MQTKTEQGLKLSQNNPFFGKWDTIVDTVAAAFNLKADDTKKLKNNKIPQLIAAIPFIAGCDDPERTAISHLGTYLLTVRTEKIFDHRPSDDTDLLRRLRMINNHVGGNKKLIKRGLNMILLNMLSDYQRDQEIDQKAGKYNPISAGKINFDKEKQKLENQINNVRSPYMDEILTVAEVPDTFWVDEA